MSVFLYIFEDIDLFQTIKFFYLKNNNINRWSQNEK